MDDEHIYTVGDMIRALSQFSEDEQLRVTWEGTIKPAEVYQAKNGVVLIDGDFGSYKESFQDGSKPAF